MPKKLTSALGIDIGSQQIKIAEIKMQGKEPTITALGMVPTPEGAVDHTGIYDPDTVGDALKALFASTGATAPAAIVSIAGQASVLVRTLEVPRMNPQELKEHMQWEITRNIPFAESTVVNDFKSFEPTDPNATNMDVVMAISPQSAVDTIVSLVKRSGKQPAAIDVEPLGIARSLTYSHGEDLAQQTVCVVEIGHKTTSINMYKDGQLLMPRQVPLGGENFTRSIADNLGLDVETAEALKVEKGAIPESAGVANAASPFASSETQGFAPYNPFADDPMLMNPGMSAPMPEPELPVNPYDAPANTYETTIPPAATDPAAYSPFGTEGLVAPSAPVPPSPSDLATTATPTDEDPETVRVYNAMAQILDEFLSEVRRSIDYFRSKGGDVNRIEICGGGARLRGLDQFLGKTLGIPCGQYDPFKKIPMNAKRLEPGLYENRGSDFAIAVGNGLHICFD